MLSVLRLQPLVRPLVARKDKFSSISPENLSPSLPQTCHVVSLYHNWYRYRFCHVRIYCIWIEVTRVHLLSAHKLYFGIILLKSSVTTDPPCAAVVGFILIFSCQCSFCRLSLRWSHRTDSISDIAACCSLYLLYPSRPGVAGGLQVVRGSRPASFSCVFFFFFLSNNGF